MNLKDYKANLDKEFKKILKTKLSINPVTLNGYKISLIHHYNEYIKYIKSIYEELPSGSKDLITVDIHQNNIKVNYCFVALKSDLRAPGNLLDTIDVPEEHFEQTQVMTTFSNSDMLKIASQSINYKYSGDPLQLESFIDSVLLIQTFATTNDLKAFLFTFIKSKLDGKAREYITNAVTSTEEIIRVLRNKIKPDSSTVIEGRILSLKYNKNDTTDFTKKAEDLADALRRSLIIEGVSPQKAEELTITKTVELCRSCTTSDVVKAVIAATKFESPKEALAKWVTESSVQVKEKQVLTFRQITRNRYDSNTKNRGYNRFNQNNRPQRNNFRHDFNRSKYTNNRYNQNNNRRNNNDNNRNNNRRFVRTIKASENSESPQARTLGEEEEN